MFTCYYKAGSHVEYRSWEKPSLHALNYFALLCRQNGCEPTVTVLAIASVLCLPLKAQEQNRWQFGAPAANSSVPKPDDQQVYEILLKMLDRWNAHDIEGYLEVYWNSPELLVVVGSEQFNGWQQLHDSYISGYPGGTAMGFIQPKRIQIQAAEA